MQLANDHLLQLTSNCSAKCSHCKLYSQNEEIKPVDELISEATKRKSDILILSGGEPLEYPHFKDFIKIFNNIDGKFYRLATGGHIPLNTFLYELQQAKNFLGISLSTDIVLKCRNNSSILKNIWHHNIALINTLKINYNLTITMDNNLSKSDLSSIKNLLVTQPSFILVSQLYNTQFLKDDWESSLNMIKNIFKVPIKEGLINSLGGTND